MVFQCFLELFNSFYFIFYVQGRVSGVIFFLNYNNSNTFRRDKSLFAFCLFVVVVSFKGMQRINSLPSRN